MAAIYKESIVNVSAEKAWSALGSVGEADKLFGPVLVDSHLEGDVRVVRFANGTVLHERILDLDENRRRIAYTALDAPGLTYHHASMQIRDEAPGQCLFTWITDFTPAEMSGQLLPLIEQGTHAFKFNLEK